MFYKKEPKKYDFGEVKVKGKELVFGERKSLWKGKWMEFSKVGVTFENGKVF